MNTNALVKTLHTLNAKKLKKPIAVCMTALFVVSMVSVLAVQPARAATTTSALHTSGSYILDTNGNTVYLRGMGLAGFAPDMILWGEGSSDNWGNQWNTDTAVMDKTFETMQSDWHINMIRVFIYPSWYYRDSIVPAQESSGSSVTTAISMKEYLKTLATEADKYGIYVDIVPYMLTPSASSFDLDPYATSNFGWQGMPMCGWDSAATQFLSDAGYANNEAGFWSWFWTDMGNTFKDYPNVIFDAWNEPNVGNDADAIPSGFMTYLTTMYNAIRSTGATNLIMMQWHMGWFPNGYGNDLSWCKQISETIPSATNLVYTTHLYYYAPSDLTSYWATDYAGLKTQLQTAIDSMGVTAPLVINEEGSCLAYSADHQRDVTWWTNLLQAQYDLGLGAGAYYWLSDSGLGPIYAGETMLTSGYTPNAMGQAYINAYIAGTTQIETPATVTPAPTEAATPAPTAVPTPEPTTAPTPEPTTNQQSSSYYNPPRQSTPIITPKPTNTPTPTEKPTATPTEEPTTEPNESTQPQPTPDRTIDLFSGFFNRHWYIFSWPRLNSWFAINFR